MSNIFQIKNAQTLHDTFIWAYTTYYNKGFSFQYFFYELNAWKKFYQITDNEKFSSIFHYITILFLFMSILYNMQFQLKIIHLKLMTSRPMNHF